MKRTRHRPGQFIGKLREADGMLATGRTIGEVGEPRRWRGNPGPMEREPKTRLVRVSPVASRSMRLDGGSFGMAGNIGRSAFHWSVREESCWVLLEGRVLRAVHWNDQPVGSAPHGRRSACRSGG
jgi:hypothetical protein